MTVCITTCLLIDARRGVMPVDDDFMRLLDDSAASFQLVITKMDALTKAEQNGLLQSLDKTIKSHVAAHPHFIATSALKKEGIEDLQHALQEFAR